MLLQPNPAAERGEVNMNTFETIIFTVVAAVISHLVCKWLDSKLK